MQKWSERSSPKNKSKEEFLATKQITVLEHPACSPDLAPNYFFLFAKIKKILKEGIMMTLMTSGVIQRQPRRSFHKTNSKIVLKGGLGALTRGVL